jgi:hypothetical protein
MEIKTFGLLGAISSLVALPGMAVSAATPFQPGVPRAQSFAELLEPIPNAVERLKIADAQDAAPQPGLVKAQYYVLRRYHRHYYHPRVIIRRYYVPYYRHRRHYYHYGYVRPYFPYGYPYFYHHHHHHHHHGYFF